MAAADAAWAPGGCGQPRSAERGHHVAGREGHGDDPEGPFQHRFRDICLQSRPDPAARQAAEAEAKGIGAFLLRDAMTRAVSVAEQAGVRLLLMHAVNEEARMFYEHFGFEASRPTRCADQGHPPGA
jgi:GNAT superfamily N-acetyltransferase